MMIDFDINAYGGPLILWCDKCRKHYNDSKESHAACGDEGGYLTCEGRGDRNEVVSCAGKGKPCELRGVR